MTDGSRVVAAIDFGTYGTGFAWALRNDPDKTIYYNEDWSGTTYPKNLSALLLDAAGNVVEWGYDARRRWQSADRISDALTYHEHFKMDLQPDGPSVAPGITAANPDAAHLATLCLGRIYTTALQHITGHAMVRPDEISWRLTVPAIWRDRERQLMRTAAEQAGFPSGARLELVIEPEAAAQHCWDHPAFTGIATPGNRFVVVDAGSGTVDITSYRVQGTVENPQLAELSRATGGKLGASYVDGQFLGPMLQSRLGMEDSWRLTADGAVRVKLLEEWERAKRDFDPQRAGPLHVNLPPQILKALYTSDEQVRMRLADAQGGVDGAIVLQPSEAKALFDHAIDPMVELVRQHLRSIGAGPVPYLLLVGGFSESRYLQQRFREAFSSSVAEVLVAPQPAVAVMFGAVKAGLKPSIASRVSRFTYGVGISMPFERGKDPKAKRFRDGYNVVRCRDRFAVFARTGDSLEVGETKWWDLSPTSPTDREFELPIYAAERTHPRFVDEPGSAQAANMTVDVSSTIGRPADKRVVRISMIFGHTEITVHARDLNTARELSTTIDFVTGG